jgi:serine/threonine protein kinase
VQRAVSVGAPALSKEWRGGSKYNKVGLAGKGAFANVYKMSHKYDGTLYAAKELEKRRFMKNGVLDQKVDMEIKIMRKINHVSIFHLCSGD